MIVISKRLQMVYRSLVCLYNRHCTGHARDNSRTWLCVVTVIVTLYWWLGGRTSDDTLGHEVRVRDKDGHVHVYNSETSPMVFIGGHPRSRILHLGLERFPGIK